MPRSPALRRVPLPGDRTLTIRLIGPADVDGVERLYARLDDDSRYRRFFSLHRPDRDFFERVVAVEARGGAGIVAAVTPRRGGRARLVGEASYEPLASGNGELEITVDAGWRGWLGPYLLDALVEVAAARGVPALEADILMTNGPMLALVRSRGYAVMPGQDWTVLRVSIGTETRDPSWPSLRRGLRVLVEGPSGRWSGQEAASDLGIDVLGCPGPAVNGRCPVLAGRPCPLAAAADAIVVAHPPDSEAWQTLRSAHSELHPGIPVCVVLDARSATPMPGEHAFRPDGKLDVVRFVERLARAHADSIDADAEDEDEDERPTSAAASVKASRARDR